VIFGVGMKADTKDIRPVVTPEVATAIDLRPPAINGCHGWKGPRGVFGL